eukprot:ANDGO_04513.mRNA.1 hypothetical protein
MKSYAHIPSARHRLPPSASSNDAGVPSPSVVSFEAPSAMPATAVASMTTKTRGYDRSESMLSSRISSMLPSFKGSSALPCGGDPGTAADPAADAVVSSFSSRSFVVGAYTTTAPSKVDITTTCLKYSVQHPRDGKIHMKMLYADMVDVTAKRVAVSKSVFRVRLSWRVQRALEWWGREYKHEIDSHRLAIGIEIKEWEPVRHALSTHFPHLSTLDFA